MVNNPNLSSQSVVSSISPSRFARILVSIALGLVLLSLLGLCLKVYTDYANLHRYIHYVVDKTNVDAELTLPAFFSVQLLLCSSVLLWFISYAIAPTRFLCRRWALLSIIFLGLAIDEGICIHEHLNISSLRAYAPTSKYLQWTWVIPYSLFTGLVFVWYLPFLRSLPRRTAILLLLAGSLYVGGAIGIEMIGSAIYTQKGYLDLSYGLISHLEELCEMLGIIVFIYGLLNYILSTQLFITVQSANTTSDALMLLEDQMSWS